MIGREPRIWNLSTRALRVSKSNEGTRAKVPLPPCTGPSTLKRLSTTRPPVCFLLKAVTDRVEQGPLRARIRLPIRRLNESRTLNPTTSRARIRGATSQRPQRHASLPGFDFAQSSAASAYDLWGMESFTCGTSGLIIPQTR